MARFPEFNMPNNTENFEFSDIIDIESLQSLLEDFYNLTHIGISLVDLEGRILANAGIQDICTQFHKTHPETAKHCIQSDIELSKGVPQGDFKIYKCKNNMWDVATPIVVDGKHIGNLFVGQFFFDDEPIDYDLFRTQARRYGFNEQSYISALNRVPRWNRETVFKVLKFYTKLAHMLSVTSYKNIVLSNSLKERNNLLGKLLESEEHLRATLHSIGDGVIVTDNKGNVTRLNAVAEELTGWTMKEANGRSLSEVFNLINENTGVKYDNLLSKILHEKNTQVLETHAALIARDGTKRPIADSAAPIYDVNGKFLGVVFVFRDQSEERTITRNLQILHSSIESSINAIALFDLRGCLTYVNPAFIRLWGYETKAQVLGTSLLDFWPDQENMEEILEHVKKYTSFYGELSGRRKDGSHLQTEVSINIVKDTGGQPLCMIASIKEITKRKQAEQALAEEVFWRRLLMEQSRDGIVILDHNGKVVEANRRFAEMLGYSRDEVGTLHVWDWDAQWNQEQLIEMMNNVSETGDHFETLHCRKDGSVFDVEISTNGATFGDKKLIFCVCRDITERKQAEWKAREGWERYKVLIAASNTGAWEYHHDTDYVWCSPEYYSMLGRDISQFGQAGITNLEEAWISMLHPEDRERAIHHFSNYLAKGSVGMYENTFRMKHADGHWVWIFARGMTLRDENGVLTNKTVGTHIDITKQKRVEEELKKQKEQYQELLESIDAVAWEYDIPSDKWIYVAPQVEKLLGYLPEEWTDLEFWVSRLHPADREWASTYCAECTKKGENHTFEYRFCKKNGGYVWLRDVVSVEISQKKPLKLRGYIIDITERKRAEEELRRERILFRTIIDHIPDSIYAKDLEGRKILANPADLMYMNVTSEEEVLGKTDFETFPSEIAEQFYHDDQTVLKNGKLVLNREEKATTTDGKEHWLLTSKIPLRDEEGQLIGLVGVGREITEQKKAEEKLRRERILLRTVIDNLPVGIYIKDLETRKILANPTDLEHMGFTKEEEALGKTDFDIYPPDIAEKFYRDDQFVLKNGKPIYNREEKATTANGRERWLLTSKIPLRDEEGQIIGLVGIGRDVTKQKQTEEHIRFLSFHDSLTGLYNRVYLEEEMKRLDTERQLPLGIIMADVNGLKLVNDAYGHQTGDELLKTATSVLKKVCRKEDIIARWGGDEFVIFLPRTSITEIETICRRITVECAKQRTETIPLSIALGTATKKQTQEDIIQVFREAEDRMYQNKLAESRSARSAVLSALRETLREKSHETEEHAERLMHMVLLMGKTLGLPSADLDRLKLLSSLHDIGKITISEDILSKPGPLTTEEWEQIRKHPETGYRIARSTDELAHVAEEILSHHERWDGTGYPRGLQGEEIPILARMSAIIDAFDAMTNPRPYRKTLSKNEALDELKRCAGTQFDPTIVKIFIHLAEKDML